MQYRRSKLAGGTYFFTVTLQNRQQSLLTDNIDLLREAVDKVKTAHPFHIDAMIVLPEHLHAIWTLPQGDHDYPKRWQLIKAGFSRGINKDEYISSSRKSKGERGIWQRRYWEHLIRNDLDYERHVDYIHFNPVKHGYVNQAVDWSHSSIHRYIKQGVISADWGVGSNFENGDFGER